MSMSMDTPKDKPNSSVASSQPLNLLLSCPVEVEQKLGAATERRNYNDGEILFEQGEACDGLYLIVSGDFARKTERWETHLNLSPLHAGDLVELAAILGDGKHTSTAVATGSASALVFPRAALDEAFVAYPLLRMHLLEELGREVSRAYAMLSFGRKMRTRKSRKDTAS